MTAPTSPANPSPIWTKAISPARDRLQSRILVGFALPVLCFLNYSAVQYAISAKSEGDRYLIMAVAISIFFAMAAWRMGAATPLAAICGGLICLSITILSGRPDGGSVFHSGLTPLILLFVSTFQATRVGRDRKVNQGLAEYSRGRNAAQVIANLGAAAWASSYYYSTFRHPLHGWQGPFILASFQGPMLAALAESTADTVSSEIGQAFGGWPFLLTTFRRVAPGTDGAISLYGTLAGTAAAALIALIGIPALGMDIEESMVVFVAAIAGLFFDTFLGATVERKGWIGNDVVNLSSTLFAAAVSLGVQGHLGMFTSA